MPVSKNFPDRFEPPVYWRQGQKKEALPCFLADPGSASNQANNPFQRLSVNNIGHSYCRYNSDARNDIGTATRLRPTPQNTAPDDSRFIRYKQPDQSQASTLKKRARGYSYSRSQAIALAELRSPLEKRYRAAYYCGMTIHQQDGRCTSRYCGQRWCTVCARIRTARAIDSYGPIVRTWSEPYFVTLTLRNCSAEDLPATLDRMMAVITSCKRAIVRTHGLTFVALRKIEVTENGHDFHPHSHLIVNGKAQAELLRSLWMQRLPDETDAKGQDVRPCDEGSLREALKYSAKMATKKRGKERRSVNGGVEALDVIFRALRGRRIIQPIGFKLSAAATEAIEGEKLELRGSEAFKRPDDDVTWIWQQGVYDWIDPDTGECYSEYEPSDEFIAFIESIGADERPSSSQQLSDDTAVDASGELVTNDDDTMMMTAPTTTTTDRGDAMITTGRFEVQGSRFSVDGVDYLLREAAQRVKGKPHFYLVDVSTGKRVSGLWHRGGNRYSIDFPTDSGERVYTLDFGEQGYVIVTGGELSRRSSAGVPWRKPKGATKRAESGR